MKIEAKRFGLRTVLTVTTGRLLEGISDLYAILGWMTGEDPMTHQLPRFNRECNPWLRQWFPALAAADSRLAHLDALIGDNRNAEFRELAIQTWIAHLRDEFPDIDSEYRVFQIPQDEHERRCPIEELVEMRGTADGIVIVETGK